MPKFMTYKRPAPVDKSTWRGKPGTNPPQPIRSIVPVKPPVAAEPEIGKPRSGKGRT